MYPIFHIVNSAPDPVAPFSHAVEQEGWIFLTGQMPFAGVANNSPYPEGIAAQTRQTMENLKCVLQGCGVGLGNVVSVRIYLTHFDRDYDPMNKAYAEFFDASRLPARTCIGVTALARGALIEIDMVARRP